MAEETGFVNRWSRRKARARNDAQRRHGGARPVLATAPDVTPLEQSEQEDALVGRAEPATPDDQVPAPEQPRGASPTVDLDALPDIETLDDASDYAAFMQDGVPEDLRTKALRRLWQIDPLFNEVDGLVEYGEDFSIAKQIAKSAYRVGKGMLTDEEHAALDAESPYTPPAEEAPDNMPDAPDERSAGGTEISKTEAEAGSDEAAAEVPPEQGKNSQNQPS